MNSLSGIGYDEKLFPVILFSPTTSLVLVFAPQQEATSRTGTTQRVSDSGHYDNPR